MSRLKNKELLDVAKRYFSEYKSFIITDYKGMNVELLSGLRNKFDLENVKYKIFKNKLVKIALKEHNINGLDEYLTGPSAFVFANNDLLASSKILQSYVKNGDLTVKVAYVDKRVVDNNYITKLSKIPSKEIILANVINSINAPIRNFVNIMNAPMQNLVFLLKEIYKIKNKK